MFSIDKVCAGYGDLKILFDIDISINEGEVVALVGSNGAGKTTILRTISGEIKIQSDPFWYGERLDTQPAYNRAELVLLTSPKDEVFWWNFCKR